MFQRYLIAGNFELMAFQSFSHNWKEFKGWSLTTNNLGMSIEKGDRTAFVVTAGLIFRCVLTLQWTSHGCSTGAVLIKVDR